MDNIGNRCIRDLQAHPIRNPTFAMATPMKTAKNKKTTTIDPEVSIRTALAATQIADEAGLIVGEPVVLASPPKTSHLPVMSITATTEYAKIATEKIREQMELIYQREGVMLIPAKDGEWVDLIRVAVTQAVQDGYCCLKAGVPVAIRADSEIVKMES